MNIFPDDECSQDCFGEHAVLYNQMMSRIGENLFSQKYSFMDNEQYVKLLKNADQQAYFGVANEILVNEILHRCHWVALSGIVRTSRWVHAVVQMYKSKNLFGWAGASRSLLESSGDITHTTKSIPMSLSYNFEQLKLSEAGKQTQKLHDLREFEELLIHYTHARKSGKADSEKKLDYLKPERSNKYIDALNREDLSISEMYLNLCELVHPAAMSVHANFSEYDDFISYNPRAESEHIINLNNKWRREFCHAVEQGINSCIMTLKVLQKFEAIDKVKGLRNTGLEHLPAWKKCQNAFAI